MTAKNKKGAEVRQVRFSERRDAWLRHHQTLAVDSLVEMLRRPISSMLTWMVIAIALSLPALMYLFLLNVQHVVGPIESGAQLTLYLDGAKVGQSGQKLAEDLQQRPEIAATEFVSAAQGLQQFREYSGLDDVIDSLGENPLPDVIVVKPVDTTAGSVESLKIMFEGLPEVSDVQLDLIWVQRINHISALAETLVGFLSVLFSMAVLLVVGNTIRLAIESRRAEILVVKLVGGTNAFVRRPFLYMGFWFGLAGGLVAWGLIALCFYLLSEPAAELLASVGSSGELVQLGFGGVFLLLVTAILISLLGTVIAVGRHIRAIEPS